MTSACPKTMLFFSQAAPAALLAPVGAEEKDAGNVGGQAARAVAASAALLRAQLRPSALLRRLCRGGDGATEARRSVAPTASPTAPACQPDSPTVRVAEPRPADVVILAAG